MFLSVPVSPMSGPCRSPSPALIHCLPVWRVELDVAGEFPLPARAVFQQLFLVIVEFFAGFRRKFEIRSFDNRIHRACFLTEAAINALHHVDVIANRAPCTVIAARTGFNGDRLGRADRLAQFAGNAAFFAIGITAQGMLTAKTRRNRTFFERVIDRRLLCAKQYSTDQRKAECLDEFRSARRDLAACAIMTSPYPAHPVYCSTAATITTMASDNGRNTFQPRRINWS